MPMPHARPYTIAAVVLAVLLAACTGGSGGPDTAADDPDAADTTMLSDVDVTFLQGMGPHHAQAVDMAELVVDRTAHPDELNPLAADIIATQQDEIDTMNALLEDAGEDPVVPAEEMGDHSGMDMGDMSGMMSEEDVSALSAAEGDAFDTLFVQMMIAHHEGAIEAAQQVLDQDGNAQVVTLAEAIVAAQQVEIAQMESWQQEWGI